MPGLATICVLFSHKANGEKAHKYRLCRHLPSYIGLGLKIVSRLYVNKENSGYASSAIVIISVRVFSRSSGVMSSVPVRGLFVTVQMHSAFLPAAAAFI